MSTDPTRIVPFSFGSDTIDTGAFAQLTCVVSHGDTPISITWSLKGDIISSEPSITTTMIGARTSILIISSVGYRHSGEYRCNAINEAGMASYSTELKVNGDLCLSEGGKGSRKRCHFPQFCSFLLCRTLIYIMSTAGLDLETSLMQGHVTEPSYQSFSPSKLLLEVNLDSSLLITISEPPEILPMTFGKEIINEGDFGQLVCTVIRGDEPLAFTWSLQGDVVSSEPGLVTSQLGTRTSILMINSVGHRHIGKYTCNVSNQAGSISATAELKVNG